MKLKPAFIICLCAVCLCACGTGGETAAPESTPPVVESVEISPAQIDELCAQSGELSGLREINVSSGLDSAGQLEKLKTAFPGVEINYSVKVCGREVPADTKELDLSSLEHADCSTAAAALELLPELQRVTLSPETTQFEDVGLFQSLPTTPAVDYAFTLYGKEFSTADETMTLSRTWISDEAAGLRAVLPYMNRCTLLEMEDCGLNNEEMAALRDDFPDIKVVWRVYFGNYSVRTDETRILASQKGVWMTAQDVDCLKYCTDVKYLDLGHNIIEDISFVSNMKDLEVGILAINYWKDASPLAACTELEYLEIFNTGCTDLSPLSSLTKLKHLNVCWLKELEDISPLYELTGLERLWIGYVNKVPQEQLEELRRRLPNTEINTTTENPTLEGWREDERYTLLREQMGYDLPEPYSVR